MAGNIFQRNIVLDRASLYSVKNRFPALFQKTGERLIEDEVPHVVTEHEYLIFPGNQDVFYPFHIALEHK